MLMEEIRGALVMAALKEEPLTLEELAKAAKSDPDAVLNFITSGAFQHWTKTSQDWRGVDLYSASDELLEQLAATDDRREKKEKEKDVADMSIMDADSRESALEIRLTELAQKRFDPEVRVSVERQGEQTMIRLSKLLPYGQQKEFQFAIFVNTHSTPFDPSTLRETKDLLFTGSVEKLAEGFGIPLDIYPAREAAKDTRNRIGGKPLPESRQGKDHGRIADIPPSDLPGS